MRAPRAGQAFHQRDGAEAFLRLELGERLLRAQLARRGEPHSAAARVGERHVDAPRARQIAAAEGEIDLLRLSRLEDDVERPMRLASQRFLFVSDERADRLSAFRSIVSRLRSGDTVLVFPAGGNGPPVAGGALVAGGSGPDELLPLPPLDAITTMSRISKARPPNATALRRRKIASCLTYTPFKRADRSTRSCGATLAPPWPDSSTPPSPTGFR